MEIVLMIVIILFVIILPIIYQLVVVGKNEKILSKELERYFLKSLIIGQKGRAGLI